MSTRKIAVLGLGYVGLPLALALAKKFPGVLGFDVNSKKVAELKRGIDSTREGWDQDLKASSLIITDQADDLKGYDFFIVGVPTPIDNYNRPDLGALQKACELLGPRLQKGAVVVFESTVFPGVTEDYCGKWLEQHSGLKCGIDFKLGYSPERINPGDKQHTLENVVKVVSGQDSETLKIVEGVYQPIITAGLHKAASIKIAEAAKVIENTQRDLNIALMNELAIIFDLMKIPTKDVIAAAASKWNFLPFRPGLVGGHCIGVDPYYLTSKAEQLGYRPRVILAGRGINDGMGKYVAQQVVKALINAGRVCKGARVGLLGLTFKENVADIRNSRVPDIIKELNEFGIEPLLNDPHADASEVRHEYGLELDELSEFQNLDALILAVAHDQYIKLGAKELTSMLAGRGVFADVKAVFDPEEFSGYHYWSL